MNAGAPAPLLEARGLRLFFGAIPALDGVSLDIWPGEVVAIVGDTPTPAARRIPCMRWARPRCAA
jgi:ABC-type phosphonate transport system ATPase subunit